MAIDSVTIYPVFHQAFISSEHPQGELPYLGDALGRDFVVIKFYNGFTRRYKGDGSKNEYWFSYKADVHAPCDAVVEKVRVVSEENEPGFHANRPASIVVFRCEDGTRISYAHVTDIQVNRNDIVKKGQAFAKCGNNGTSWHPHIHVGAWKDKKPLQIRVDLEELGEIMQEQQDDFYFLPGDKETKKKIKESFINEP